MYKESLTDSDRFYFYNASFDPIDLIKSNAIENQTGNPGFFTNAFGVLIKPDYFPFVLAGKGGTVEEIPIPSNWHADIAEFGAAFRAIELSGNTFNMVELGCGWGCWMNITGVVAKRKGKKVKIYGVEGAKGNIQLANDALTTNGFLPEEYEVFHGIATAKPGFALFPVYDQPGLSWGGKPLFDISAREAEKLVRSGRYMKLPQVTISELGDKIGRIDLLHVDIQGGELELIPNAINPITKTVAYLLIGTHSRQIEGVMHDTLLKAGWILEIERPAIIEVGEKIKNQVDGVQGWRNPRLLPNDASLVANIQGKIEILDVPKTANVNTYITIPARIYNRSKLQWREGRYPVRVSYHWLDQDQNIVTFDGERTILGDKGIEPGQALKVNINIKMPEQPGKYKLQLTLVREGLMWFESQGFQPTVCEILAKK